MTWYVLINRTNAIPGESIGTVISCHKTIEAAKAADDKLYKDTVKRYGSMSYTPTVIVLCDRKPAHKWISNQEWSDSK